MLSDESDESGESKKRKKGRNRKTRPGLHSAAALLSAKVQSELLHQGLVEAPGFECFNQRCSHETIEAPLSDLRAVLRGTLCCSDCGHALRQQMQMGMRRAMGERRLE